MTFSALADPNRRALLESLEAGEQTLSNLASPLPISLMAIQKHIHVLEKAELVTTNKIGRNRYVRLRIDGLLNAADWMQNTKTRWNAALERLEEEVLEEENKQK
jgi:DNA-binding transcriptional ArsR family regulator